VGGTGVSVGGTSVLVGGTGVFVGGSVAVGSTAVVIGGSGAFVGDGVAVTVGGNGVAVGGMVGLGGTGVAEGRTGVAVGGNGVGVHGEGPNTISPITSVAFGVPVVVALAVTPPPAAVGGAPGMGVMRAIGVMPPTIVPKSPGVPVGTRVGVGPVVLVGGRVIVTTGELIAVTTLAPGGAHVVAMASNVAVSSGVATTPVGISTSAMPINPATQRAINTRIPLPTLRSKLLSILPPIPLTRARGHPPTSGQCATVSYPRCAPPQDYIIRGYRWYCKKRK